MWMDVVNAFDPWNAGAIGIFLIGWLFYPLIARLVNSDDLTAEITLYRIQWLTQMLSREDRITDVSLARGLFSSVMFLASTSILLISGLLGVLVTASYLHGLVQNSAWLVATSLILFETKIIFLIIIQAHSFFKFTWSMRLHSYTMILIGAAPNVADHDSEVAKALVDKGAKLSSFASKSYFSGLRGYYFGLAALTWFISPEMLIIATVATTITLIHREQFSLAIRTLKRTAE
jgi:uncharacterized membrane protein